MPKQAPASLQGISEVYQQIQNVLRSTSHLVGDTYGWRHNNKPHMPPCTKCRKLDRERDTVKVLRHVRARLMEGCSRGEVERLLTTSTFNNAQKHAAYVVLAIDPSSLTSATAYYR